MSRAIDGIIFRTALSPKQRYYTSEGSREAEDYEVQIDKKGHKSLKLVGTHDIYEEIQSYADECNISLIIARAAAGDPNALNQRQGFYADITETPKDLAEAQNSILKLKQGFYKLPVEIREKFNHSEEQFIAEFGSEEFAKKMGFETGTNENISEKKEFVPGTEKTAEPLTPEGE